MQMDYSIFSRFRGFRVLVGFSGGADSTALLLFVSQGAERFGFEVTAVHFNHHLRGAESDAEAEAAGKFAREHRINFRKIDLFLAPGGNLESRARQARLAHFRELAGDDRNTVVMLGHHAGDRVENLFLRLLRGSNVSGLTGLHQESLVSGVRIFRPLIDWQRVDIERFLSDNGVKNWAQDSSNFSEDYSRNFIRNRILPQLYGHFPAGESALLSSLENLESDAAFIEKEAQQRLSAGDAGKIGFWLTLPQALLVRCLRNYLEQLFGVRVDLSAGSIKRFSAAVKAGTAGKIPLGSGITLIISADRLIADADIPEDRRWNWREEPEFRWGNWHFYCKIMPQMPETVTPECACFSADSLPEILTVGAIRPGEKMLPFGRKKAVKIKELRVKRKVPALPVVPVFRDPGGEVVWVPSVRHSAGYPVAPGGECVSFFGEKTEDFN